MREKSNSSCPQGFTRELSGGLGAVSVEARLLVSRLLTVSPNLRIKVVSTTSTCQATDATLCSWVTDSGTLPPVDTRPCQERDSASQLVVAAMVRERLHLSHLSPKQVPPALLLSCRCWTTC